MAAPSTTRLKPAIPQHSPPLGLNGSRRHSDHLIDLVIKRRFAGHREFEHLSHASGTLPAPEAAAPPSIGINADNPAAAVDYFFLTDHDPHQPADVFDRLRWGGQLVLVSRNAKAIAAAVHAYQTWRNEQDDHSAWLIEQLPKGGTIELRPLLRLFGWRTPVHIMLARKVMLVPPGKSSDRFTYHVHLDKNAAGAGYQVVKEVPTIERVVARLREKFPDADQLTLRRRARKFTDKIFPVFLTRETAILKLLQRDLPPRFRDRVPHVISGETDAVGYVRTLRMNWLRNARPLRKSGSLRGQPAPLSQLEFAHQAAELLAVLHDKAGIMHLDLRLDNVVITEHGVSFVDFGSAVRVGEAFPDASLLSNLFEEMMRTSQIQRMLGKMSQNGQVTSEEIKSSHQRIDKAVDFFYLAVQINNPLSNPDFRGLVEFDPAGRQAQELAKLTEKILRPENPEAPEFTSAKDILKGIEEIERRLQNP